MDILASLNPQQREAVTTPPGPVLVQAGAGTGKTRVLTLRIAYLIEHYNVAPANILALTFTNKAAKELRERLHALLGRRTRGLTCGTFHATCAKMLRADIAERLGRYTADFTIYAQDEQLQVAAQALNDAKERPPIMLEPEHLVWRISRLKSRLQDTPTVREIARIAARSPEDGFIAGCYRRYQRTLERNNAVDFDDLIRLTHKLLSEHPDVLEAYQERWQHILVDEYQDTDPSQSALLKLLSRPSATHTCSLFVVGDGMQSIYGFRNADYRIIASFTEDYPDAHVCNLTTNYRSRQTILDVAYAVSRNSKRIRPLPLQATTSAHRDERCLHIIDAKDSRDEAEHIARCIGDLERERVAMGKIAILYRTQHMSRLLETALRQARIPYRVRGSTGFYDRAVIRDALAYLRVIANPGDNLSLTRIASRPPRGIGEQSMATLAAYAAEKSIPLVHALGDAHALSQVSAKATKGARALAGLYRRWQQFAAAGYPPDHLLTDVLEHSGYLAWLTEQLETDAFRESQEHIQELMTAAQEHTTLSSFLQEVALLTNADKDNETSEQVELLTIHAAKGLEWPVVFVAGLEEGTLPHERSIGTAEGIEEERRLCYVAITRAGERLYLSWATGRKRGQQMKPSRFLKEIEAYGRERSRT